MTMSVPLLGAALLLLLAPSALAGWAPEGTRVCASPGHQCCFSAAPDGAGGAIICWLDYRDGPAAVFAERLTPGGEIATGWPGEGLRISATARSQEATFITADGTGGAIISWQDDRPSDAGQGPPGIYAIRITRDGLVAPGWPATGVGVFSFRICFSTYSVGPIVADGNGGATICFS